MIRDLFSMPVIERPSRIHAGMIFGYGGRLLRVHRVYPGDDPATPVIVEELAGGSLWLAGQYALWSAGSIMRVMNGDRQ